VVDGQPPNFGIVIPGFYRSAFPRTKDHKYLESLGLKTIVYVLPHLVLCLDQPDQFISNLSFKDHSDGYQAFILKNGFKHIVINMQGTKKVAIPKAIMNSVLEVVLDAQNYPLLLHCNHGKVSESNHILIFGTYCNISIEPAAL
jgi:tyrosine-protein phosphatase SIW14